MKSILTACFVILSGMSFAQETLQSVADRGNRTTPGLELNIPSLNPNKYLFLGGGAGYSRIGAYDWVNGFDNLIVDVSKMGIGTTIPVCKLEVATNTDYDQLSLTKNSVEYYKGAGVVFRNSVDDGDITEIGGVQARLLNGSTGNVAGSLSFYTKVNSSKVEAITINPQGNMGIGTTNPKDKLSVNGNIRAREIKVEATNWPDYVFEDGYKVGTLKGLESYIKTNKHLPEMPTAKEVETNGIAVSEMLKLQQKKIEELTLHLIELSKKVETQDAYIKQLKNKK